MAPSRVLRAIVGFSCAGSLLASEKACDGGEACAAEERLDDFSTLQLGARGAARAPNVTGKAQRRMNSKPKRGQGRDLDEDDVLLIDEDGVLNKYYLPGANIIDGGKTVEYWPPWRYYLMKYPTFDFSNADNFYKPIFPGKTFTVDMKLTNVGCGCNLNFYLVDMPVANAGKDGDHYCDAQCFEGLGCCAEFDMNEGNCMAQQITNHACTHNYQDHPDWVCDKWGTPHAETETFEFAPGTHATIDASKTFTFSQEFRVTNGQLEVITTISQGHAQIVKTLHPDDQMYSMWKDGSLERGMAFVTGYWTSSAMNWLDGKACGSGPEHCSGDAAYISNWRITTNGGPAPAPGPPPGPTPPPPDHMCCYGDLASCKPQGDWCAESKENCEGPCLGRWSKVEYKCCYGDGYCKEEGNWCNEAESHCTGSCNGQYTPSLVPSPAPPPPMPPAPAPSNAEYKCCYGTISSCKQPGDWCAQSKENCEGACEGHWSKIEHKCCYDGGYCKEEGDWCNEAESHCTGNCNGQWTELLA